MEHQRCFAKSLALQIAPLPPVVDGRLKMRRPRGSSSAKEANTISIHSAILLQNLIIRTPSKIRKVEQLELLKIDDLPMSALVVF